MALTTIRDKPTRNRRRPKKNHAEEGDWQEIEIFRAGTHTDSGGFTREWSSGDIDQIVDSYDPKLYKAPLIVSHDIDAYSIAWVGEDDTEELSDAEKHRAVLEASLAYGWPAELVRRGQSLFARFERIDPQFVDWVRNGNLMAISCSFYMEDHPANPKPGNISLRHIAALGTQPPAVKGMELDLSEALLAFSSFKSEPGCLTFSFEVNQPGSQSGSDLGSLSGDLDSAGRRNAASQVLEHIAYLDGVQGLGPFTETKGGLALIGDVLGRMRESLVAEQGVEAAEALIPRDVVGKLQGAATLEVAEAEDLYDQSHWIREEFRGQLDGLYRAISEIMERLPVPEVSGNGYPAQVKPMLSAQSHKQEETPMKTATTPEQGHPQGVVAPNHSAEAGGGSTPQGTGTGNQSGGPGGNHPKESGPESTQPAGDAGSQSGDSGGRMTGQGGGASHSRPPETAGQPTTYVSPPPRPAQQEYFSDDGRGGPQDSPAGMGGHSQYSHQQSGGIDPMRAFEAAFQAKLEKMEQSFTQRVNQLETENQRLQADRDVLTGQVVEHRQEAILTHFSALVKELGLPPALTRGFIARLEGAPNYTEGQPVSLPQFAASLSAPGRIWFEEMLRTVGASFKPLSREIAPAYEAPPQQTEEYDPKTIARQARAYADNHGVDYPVALDAVLNGES